MSVKDIYIFTILVYYKTLKVMISKNLLPQKPLVQMANQHIIMIL